MRERIGPGRKGRKKNRNYTEIGNDAVRRFLLIKKGVILTVEFNSSNYNYDYRKPRRCRIKFVKTIKSGQQIHVLGIPVKGRSREMISIGVGTKVLELKSSMGPPLKFHRNFKNGF